MIPFKRLKNYFLNKQIYFFSLTRSQPEYCRVVNWKNAKYLQYLLLKQMQIVIKLLIVPF